MFFEQVEVITCLYGMKMESKSDPKRDKKLKAAIEYLGDKYCLSKKVGRKDAE
jgi:hypothetical protein